MWNVGAVAWKRWKGEERWAGRGRGRVKEGGEKGAVTGVALRVR